MGDPDVPVGEHLPRSTRWALLRPRQPWWELEHHHLELQPGHHGWRRALLYEITGTASYLTAAETTAEAAVSHFGTGTTLQSQGPAFNGIYFRDLFVLNQVQPNKDYRSEAKAYAKFMWTQRAPSGLFLQNGQTNGVNGTAPMVELYSLLAGSTARP